MGGGRSGVWSSVWGGGVRISARLSQRRTEEGLHSVPEHQRLRKPALPLRHGYVLFWHLYAHIILLCRVFSVGLCVIAAGAGGCDPGESSKNNVVLFGRSEGRKDHVLLDVLPYSAYRVSRVFNKA